MCNGFARRCSGEYAKRCVSVACERREALSWKESADYLPEAILLGRYRGRKTLKRDLQWGSSSSQEPAHGPARQAAPQAGQAGADTSDEGFRACHDKLSKRSSDLYSNCRARF